MDEVAVVDVLLVLAVLRGVREVLGGAAAGQRELVLRRAVEHVDELARRVRRAASEEALLERPQPASYQRVPVRAHLREGRGVSD